MTFQQLIQSLPNGFHDAELQRFEMDYVQRQLRFDLDVWVGDMDDVQARETYRPARLTLDQVAYLVIESPDESYPWGEPGGVTIDAGEGTPKRCTGSPPDAPEGTSAGWMYLEDLNRFLLFAAGAASLEWLGSEENRT